MEENRSGYEITTPSPTKRKSLGLGLPMGMNVSYFMKSAMDYTNVVVASHLPLAPPLAPRVHAHEPNAHVVPSRRDPLVQVPNPMVWNTNLDIIE
ncbi:hypothetical protein E3N88_21934 [Mikania micrantha]|uniref:Uncharacterized protein n=1 Tax=Mikania micrantha TaxID=192012 RepID=A0A5N6NAH4_9ASTR|nr:hypothetical protein E3N88_21934 [Mikania micrantha]